MKTHKLTSVIGNMLKIGLIGFGGGTALIPVLEKELVGRSKIVSEETFNRDVTIASITPGALPVEIAAGIGREAAGNAGMIAAAAAMAFPGAFLTLLLLLLFSGMNSTLRSFINILAAAVSVYIIVLLLRYVAGTLKQSSTDREKLLYLLVILSVFALSAEKNLYRLLGTTRKPLFAASSVQILAAAFFVILFTKGELRRLKRTMPALLLTLVYFLCAGDAQILPAGLVPFLTVLMTVLAALGFFQSVREAKAKNLSGSKQKDRLAGLDLLRTMFFWLLFLLVLSLPAILLTVKSLSFIGTGVLSSVMSFGGGDAYLTVAQGLFVESGMISHADFYSNIVTVANALPGSILCKILTGVGYSLGYHLHNSIPEGIMMAVCGFACSVAASGSIYLIVWGLFQKYGDLRIFATIRHFIRPIVSGLLLNVALSLFLSVICPVVF